MDQNDTNSPKKLYELFKISLSYGNICTGFEEDDLLDIFDYAADAGDDYTQLEALFAAARICPDSEAFAQRRAYYYALALDMKEGAANILKSRAGTSAAMDVLEVLIAEPRDPAMARARLESVVNRYDNMDDETIIQFVGVCNDLDLYDWLKAVKPRLQKRCRYPDTLLYELVELSERRSDYKYSRELLEELTMIEPFNSEWWYRLAINCSALNDNENALQAIDFALAIDSKSLPLRVTKAVMLYDANPSSGEGFDMMLKIVNDAPDDVYAVRSLVTILEQLDIDQARKILATYFDGHPESREALEHLLMISSSQDNVKYLNKYFNALSEIDKDEIISWAQPFVTAKTQVAADIMSTLWSYAGRMNSYSVLLESLYRDSRYEKVCEFYEWFSHEYGDAHTQHMVALLTATDRLIGILALWRCGRIKEASDLTKIALLIMQATGDDIGGDRIINFGLRSTFLSISEKLDNNPDSDPSDFDPYA